MKCALIKTVAPVKILREEMHDEVPAALSAAKGMQWYALVDAPPAFDSNTQLLKPDGLQLDDEARTATQLYRIDAMTVPAILAKAAKALDQKLTDYFDEKAAERNYSSRYTCQSRAGYPGPFQEEGTAFAIWMDSCNLAAYQIQAAVVAGERSIPTWTELKAELPTLTWPASVI